MAEREEIIIGAAMRVFTRYGVRRATMVDIAEEAGVARQTLYNVYAGKEDVLRAAIRWYAEHSLAVIEAECAAAATLGEQLDIVFKHTAVKPFELLNESPHADDIISGFNAAAREEISHAEKRIRAAIEQLLTPYEAPIRAAGLSPRRLADVVQRSYAGFKLKAENKKHLQELLTSLKVLVLTLVGAA
ncbi:MAG: TetR/AcrR family transcriptional regulator [Alphaproteobacteria bacterium]